MRDILRNSMREIFLLITIITYAADYDRGVILLRIVMRRRMTSRLGACIPYRECLLFKHDNMFKLKNKNNFGAKIFIYY
jgi:hypothetical protein